MQQDVNKPWTTYEAARNFKKVLEPIRAFAEADVRKLWPTGSTPNSQDILMTELKDVEVLAK